MVPCYMCTDIPCVPVCPSGALDIDLVSVIKEGSNEKELDINKSGTWITHHIRANYLYFLRFILG